MQYSRHEQLRKRKQHQSHGAASQLQQQAVAPRPVRATVAPPGEHNNSIMTHLPLQLLSADTHTPHIVVLTKG